MLFVVSAAAITPAIAQDASSLLQAADKALYAAKANGRNQCMLASPPKLSLVA